MDYSRRRGAYAAKARKLGLHSVAGAPIIVDGAVWGLVTIASTGGPLPDRTENRLAEFTELMGTAIANTQSRAELPASRARIVAAADETRRRLERDLHDGIQQRLVSLALKARTTEMMTPRPADEIQGELSLLADGLGIALDELRERAVGDRTREIGRRVGRDQDHGRQAITVACGQTPGKLKPALTPSMTSTRTISGRSSSARCSASAEVAATPTTHRPSRSKRSRQPPETTSCRPQSRHRAPSCELGSSGVSGAGHWG